MVELAGSAVGRCAQCSSELGPTLLACPACNALVHAAQLKRLSSEAIAARSAGELSTALARWRAALDLLPPSSQQHAQVAQRIAELASELDSGIVRTASAPATPRSFWRRAWAPIAAALLFVLTKAKLLLLGLTKAGTLFSMLAFLGVYWQIWGWKFALGFVISLYIHEMGHVAMLRHYGYEASSPMFIPGFGAFVRLKQHPTDVRQDARIGLAGPVWGWGAALACSLVFSLSHATYWAALARAGAWLNLFNLLPLWQLDGGRAFRSLTRAQRWIACAAVLTAWLLTKEGLLILLALAAGFRALSAAPSERDRGALATYVGLVAALAWIAHLPVDARLPG